MDPHSSEKLDPDPHESGADLQPWFPDNVKYFTLFKAIIFLIKHLDLGNPALRPLRVRERIKPFHDPLVHCRNCSVVRSVRRRGTRCGT